MLPKPNRSMLCPNLCQDLHHQPLPTPHPPHCHQAPHQHVHSALLPLCSISPLILSTCPPHLSQQTCPPSTPLHPPLRNPHQSPRRLLPQSCLSPHRSSMAQLRNWLLLPVSLSRHLLHHHLLLLHQSLPHPFPRRPHQTAWHLLLPPGRTALSSPPPAPVGCLSWSHLLSSLLPLPRQGSPLLRFRSSLTQMPQSLPQGAPTPPQSSHPPARGVHHHPCMCLPSITRPSQPIR